VAADAAEPEPAAGVVPEGSEEAAGRLRSEPGNRIRRGGSTLPRRRHHTDHPRSITTKGPGEFGDWLKGWVETFSDAEVADARYIDGGDQDQPLPGEPVDTESFRTSRSSH